MAHSESHVVYATTRSGNGDFHHYRVSPDLSWPAAQARWDGLDLMRRAKMGLRVGGLPVDFFSVRSADDHGRPYGGIQYHVLVPMLPGVYDFGYECV
jgi:hypothetical protein